MRLFILQIISAIVLLSFLTIFAGVALIVTTESPAAIGAGNNHCNPDGAQSCPLPCATPLCPLCVCAIADTVQRITILTSFQAMEFEFPDASLSLPDLYVIEIFHPPRREIVFNVRGMNII